MPRPIGPAAALEASGLPHRMHRRSGEVAAGELRSPFEKDRDRVLYSHAFLRLAGVTQVSSSSPAGSYHSRFSHSVKVAQIGAALARALVDRYHRTLPEIVDMVNPLVVEAAGLAHDMGHPPGGHNGEKALSKWSARHVGEPFEGNAQTFRLLARLADRAHDLPGLDLTRATLLASTKYPWSSKSLNAKRTGKFGYFVEDAPLFRWAAEGTQAARGIPTLEAQIMDWADDVTYAVHDTQDWFRSGEIALHELIRGTDLALEYAEHLWGAISTNPSLVKEYASLPEVGTGTELSGHDAFVRAVAGRFEHLGDLFVGLDELDDYEGSFQQRSILVHGAAQLLGQVVEGPTEGLTRLPFTLSMADGSWFFRPDEWLKLDILLLKGLLFEHVVDSLADEQSAEWVQLNELSTALLGVLRGRRERHLVGELAEIREGFRLLNKPGQARYVLDLVAGLTDAEFSAYYRLYCEASSDAGDVKLSREAALPPRPKGIAKPRSSRKPAVPRKRT